MKKTHTAPLSKYLLTSIDPFLFLALPKDPDFILLTFTSPLTGPNSTVQLDDCNGLSLDKTAIHIYTRRVKSQWATNISNNFWEKVVAKLFASTYSIIVENYVTNTSYNTPEFKPESLISKFKHTLILCFQAYKISKNIVNHLMLTLKNISNKHQIIN